MSEKTFSEEDVRALVDRAVAERTAELQAKVSEFESSQQTAAIEQRIATATAEADSKLADMQAELDKAVLEATTAKTERDSLIAWLEGEKAAAEAAAEIASRKQTRTERVAQVATFPAEYVEKSAERWAALDDEAFEALLSDYAAVAQTSKKTDTAPGTETAMQFERATDSGSKVSAVRTVLSMRHAGIDTRTV